jgi:magnesium-transporting ATPase (P-type)
MSVRLAIEILINITVFLRGDNSHVKSVMVTVLLAIARKVIILDLSRSNQRSFGPNTLVRPKGQGPLLRFLLQFHQALVYIPLAAIVIKLFLGAWVDAGVIFGGHRFVLPARGFMDC